MFSKLQQCHDRRPSLNIHRLVTIKCSGNKMIEDNHNGFEKVLLAIVIDLPVNCHCAIRDANVFHWLYTQRRSPYRSWRQWSPRATLKWSPVKWNLAAPQVNAINRRMLCESILVHLKQNKWFIFQRRNICFFFRFILVDPDTTSPNSALMTTAVTACSCPVSVARGVGTSPSPTMLCVLAFQCHNKTVQSAEPDAM